MSPFRLDIIDLSQSFTAYPEGTQNIDVPQHQSVGNASNLLDSISAEDVLEDSFDGIPIALQRTGNPLSDGGRDRRAAISQPSALWPGAEVPYAIFNDTQYGRFSKWAQGEL